MWMYPWILREANIRIMQDHGIVAFVCLHRLRGCYRVLGLYRT